MDFVGMNTRHAIPVGIMTVAVAKTYTSASNLNVPFMTQLEAGAVAGASAVVADHVLPGQPAIVRGLATGALLSAGMFFVQEDKSWQIYLPLGAGAYLLSNYVWRKYLHQNINRKSRDESSAYPDSKIAEPPINPGTDVSNL